MGKRAERTCIRLAVAISALAVCGIAQADSGQETLKRFADGVQTFEAHFDQVQSDDSGKPTARSSGHFWLERPPPGKADAGKFRWVYEKPYQQQTICDGDKLWAYDPDLNQATVRDAHHALSGTPAELLSQRGALSTAFSVKDGGASGDSHLVTLVPKNKDSDFKSIELAIDKEGAPVRMRFADQIGGQSEISFSDVHTNGRIDPQEFQFVPPKDVDIVKDDGSQPAARSTE